MSKETENILRFAALIAVFLFIPGLPKRLNQEARDAALLAWDYAGFSIRIKPTFK